MCVCVCVGVCVWCFALLLEAVVVVVGVGFLMRSTGDAKSKHLSRLRKMLQVCVTRVFALRVQVEFPARVLHNLIGCVARVSECKL